MIEDDGVGYKWDTDEYDNGSIDDSIDDGYDCNFFYWFYLYIEFLSTIHYSHYYLSR